MRARWPLTLACLVAALRAQPVAGTGSISGVVHDTTGAAIADARVELFHLDLGIQRSLATNSAGLFSVQALVPSDGYEISVTKEGFAAFQAAGIEVLLGENVSLHVILELPVARTRVAVEEMAPAVESTRTGVSQLISATQIGNLPINGRRVDSFALLTPAVVPDGVQGLVSFRGIAGGNAFLTDGNDTSNQFFHENAGRTRIATQISQDAVQEFQVLSSGYSAEYGRASGGIINTLTRSGSNSTHGTVYWFFRNRAFNARDRYSFVNPPERRNQTGASLGGRLVKDRLFYFLNAESPRRKFPLVSSLARPPLFDAGGRFIGRCDAPAARCDAALRYLDRHFQVLDRTANSELGFAKLDWRPTQRHSVSASFNYLRFLSPNGFQTQASLNNGEAAGNNGESTVRVRYGRVAWVAIPSGRMVNELRFGWFKDRHHDTLDAALVPRETGRVQITVEGQPYLGVSAEIPRLYPSENRYQLANNYTLLAGRHAWKFGYDFVQTEDFLRNRRNQFGTYDYPDFTAFALDFSGNDGRTKRWQTYSQRFGAESLDITLRDYDFFVQDQFRLTSRLTLNFGVRHEYTHLPQPRASNAEYPETGRIPRVKTNWAPRGGVAFSFHNARGVLRAGYGIFHARYHGGVINTFFLENGVAQQSVSLERRFLADLESGPVFPASLPAATARPADPAFVSTVDLTIPSPDYRNPYSQQADLGVEHSLGRHLEAGVSYLWSRGLYLTTVRDLNIGPEGVRVSYRIEDPGGVPLGVYTTAAYRLVNRVNTRWRRVNSVESGGNSYYNALVAQLRRRGSKGLEAFVAYTWSHAIDFNQGGGRDNIFFSEGPRTLGNGDYRREKSSSQLDQRHRLVASLVAAPRFTGRTTALAKYLINNWRYSQISTFASAQPSTPAILVVGVPFPGAAFNTTLNGFGGSTRAPFLPPSSLDIDQVYRTDARLTKVLPFSDRFEAHVSFEAFNLFNRTSDTSVSTVAYEARNGILRPVPGLGAGVASEGYPDGTNARRAQISLRLTW
ncbi:MAG: carboxypeptidase regulatory-like domain-containing protein [Bryobacteraceae bacterium]